MEGEEMSFKLDKICKSYGDNVIFRDFDMEFEEGVISCILGPSGCGKTTLLNIIGSIAEPDSGVLSGFSDKKFSYIFQEPRLLPWKTVRGNIEFVLNRTLPARERRENADKLINMVELNGFANYYPAQLSGGMKQRVSIARAFASPSDIILMDEPLAHDTLVLKYMGIR
jgi:NitT/TauT family transport system ATP-binding protein